jgi:hypothetical protein
VTALNVILDGDGCWPDIRSLDPIVAIARLPGGMASGASSVSVRIEMADGTFVHGQTSLAHLSTAIEAFRAADAAEAEKQAQPPVHRRPRIGYP